MSADKFALCSGGIDSVVATHKMMTEAEADQKRPLVIYLDTGIGLPANRCYVEYLCDQYGWQVWKLRTHERYAEKVAQHGYPGPKQHSTMFNFLKDRQLQKLSTVSGDAHYYTGIRRDESEARADTPRVHEYQRATWHAELAEWSRADCERYISEHEIPINPLWEKSHFTDCGCGAYAAVEELIEIEAEGYERFAAKLLSIDADVNQPANSERSLWGWASLNPKEFDAVIEAAEGERSPGMLCGPSCGAAAEALFDTRKTATRQLELPGTSGGDSDG